MKNKSSVAKQIYLFFKLLYNKYINDTCTKQNLNIVYTIITSIHDICIKVNLLLRAIMFSLREKKIMLFIFHSKKKKHVNVFVFRPLQ